MGWESFQYICGDTACDPTQQQACRTGYKCENNVCKLPCNSDYDCLDGSKCQDGYCSNSTVPGWVPKQGSNISRLRFSDCIFTITTPDGRRYSQNVTPALNSMAVAYTGSTIKMPNTLYLSGPLNAFSFVIPGVNDRRTLPTSADAETLDGSACSLTGKYRTI